MDADPQAAASSDRTAQAPVPGDSAGEQTGADHSHPDPSAPVRLTAFVRGRVQGVGFRWWARARALELGLAGSAANLPDGRVQVVAEGERGVCERLLRLLEEQPSTASRPGTVTGVSAQWGPRRGGHVGFVER
jgi:acylphosphatase